jgi:transposase
MSQKGSSVKDIAKKTGLSERVVRSYIWRAKNPEKFKALLVRYQTKRKKKLAEKATQARPNEEKKQNPNEKA